MKREYNFSLFGIDESFELFGKVEVLYFLKGLPTVFLLDEHHGNLNNCIDKNVENAKELIERADIGLIGVESYAGGKSWDPENQRYSEQYSNKKFDDKLASTYKNNCLQFVDGLKAEYQNLICGVESITMMYRIGEDFLDGNKYHGTEVSAHPLQIERTKHFLNTLFGNYQTKLLDGNLILNCGRNHNTDIESWINRGEIEDIVGFNANYIRINTIDSI